MVGWVLDPRVWPIEACSNAWVENPPYMSGCHAYACVSMICLSDKTCLRKRRHGTRFCPSFEIFRPAAAKSSPPAILQPLAGESKLKQICQPVSNKSQILQTMSAESCEWLGWHGQTRLTVLPWKCSVAEEDTLKLRLGVPPKARGWVSSSYSPRSGSQGQRRALYAMASAAKQSLRREL